MNITHSGYDCKVLFGRYYNGNNAIKLVDVEDGELVATVSVNGVMELHESAVGIKTWSENEGIVQSLVDGGVIEPELLGTEPTGFVEIEHYKLTSAALKEIGELKGGRKK